MKPNHLIRSTSPYLLQHAYNPVAWHEWGEEALTMARELDRPVLVSIGYSSCHWCHVMERESFENERIASIMNEHFVCIKVDREERPDIDQIYMEAVQAMGINGGWPLHVFLTPDQKPFYGGTYFPPRQWAQLLEQIAGLYKSKRQEIAANAEQLSAHIAGSDLAAFRRDPDQAKLDVTALKTISDRLLEGFDPEWGGHDRAPKFVMPAQWTYLLTYHHLSGDEPVLDKVRFTLKKIASGGIYDQVGGGFARYSVDNRWFAPHFEKMLYDNAQLLSLYSEAYKVTGEPLFRILIEETAGWLQREMRHPGGGFYSALDADSEGEEGKYYVWKKQELDRLVPAHQAWLLDYFSVTDSGNWEHGNNILFVQQEKKDFLEKHGLEAPVFDEALEKFKDTLLRVRSQRVRPGLDDKVIAGWNALATIGLLDAYTALGRPVYREHAEQNVAFIEQEMIAGGRLYRSWKGRRSGQEAFLEDYAYLVAAYLKLYQITFDESYLHKARQWTDYVLGQFFDPEEQFFFYTSANSEPLIARKKEVFDNVIPSSNAMMARNLYHLGILFDEASYKTLAVSMTQSLAGTMVKEPGYLSFWVTTFAQMAFEPAEVVIVGKKSLEANLQLQRQFFPLALFQGTTTESSLPLIRDKHSGPHDVTFFVCYNKTCKMPVHDAAQASAQLLRRSTRGPAPD